MSRKRKVNQRLQALRSKPPRYWTGLGAWFSFIGYVAYLSAIHAIANITWQPNPDLALRFVPDHPLALSRKADMMFADKQDAKTLAKVETMARQSLRGGALNPVAIRLLGYVADVRGERQKARELMLLSQKVSRRDFGTQLWLIEDAVARGDKKQALYHYDIAMRTTPSSHIILFPTLIGALEDPEVRAGLAPYISRAPEWLPTFWSEALNTSSDPANVADLMMRAAPLPERVYTRSLANGLLAQLAFKGRMQAFGRYYLSLPGSTPSALRSASMDKNTVNLDYPIAGWQLSDNPATGGTFSPAGKSGRHSLLAFAGSGERGELMRKYLFLTPGNYRFSATYEVQDISRDSEIRWNLQCLPESSNISNWSAVNAIRAGKWATTRNFSLGTDCPYQILSIQVAGGDSQTGAEFTLRSVDIVKR